MAHTDARERIIAFVDVVTDPASEDYVTPSDRIAVFDNDGTLWGEQPVYFQLIYAVDEVKEMAKADPSILTSEALKAAADGDFAALAEGGEKAILEVISTGLTVDLASKNFRSVLQNGSIPLNTQQLALAMTR